MGEFRPLVLGQKLLLRESLRLYRTDFQLAPLDKTEVEIFNAQFPTLLAAPTSITREIQLQRIEAYIGAIRAIKQALNGIAFRGLNPTDTELGFQPIRPQFTHDPDTSAYRVNWNEPALINTWTEFIGDGVGAAAVGYALPADFGMVVTHLTSLVTPAPFISEMQTDMGRTHLVPFNLRDMLIGDNINGVSVYPIPTLLLLPRDTWFMQIMCDVAGTVNLQPGGFVIGLGRRLNETVPAW